MSNGRSRGEAGYTLVGLMIAVAVVNVALAAVVTSWRTLDQRARETEAIWRGQRIAAAIPCYRQGDAGEPLVRLEQLVEAGCLRRVYTDPLTRSGAWRILRQSDVDDGTVASLLGTIPDVGATAGTPTPLLANRPAGGSGTAPDPIVGVASTASGAAHRVLRGQARYEGWLFLADGS